MILIFYIYFTNSSCTLSLSVVLFLARECSARRISQNVKPTDDAEFHSRVRRAASRYRKRWNMDRDNEGNFIVPIAFLNVSKYI